MNRFEITKRASILGILGNVFLLIIKGIIGFISNSQALIADAANSAGDIFASLMSSIGNKIASEPSDESHNLGHGKAEYIFSMFISISMVFVSLKILYDSLTSIVLGNKLLFSWSIVIVCIVTIVIKLTLYIYTKKAYKTCDNILLKASMKDHRNDCIVTAFTTISVLLTLLEIYWVDGVVGIGISIWILITGVRLFSESFNILMDKSVDEETKNSILEYISKYPEIKKIEEMYTVPIGYKYIVVFTICLDGELDTFTSHEIADKLQNDIEKDFDQIDKVMIHVNPMKLE